MAARVYRITKKTPGILSDSEESTSICKVAIQGEEDPSSLRMTISVNEEQGIFKNACHSECNEESSALYGAAKQGEEDASYLPMTSLKNACHSECSEESSAIYRAAKQGEEDPSSLRMTIRVNVISPSEAPDLNTQDDNKH